MYLSLFHCIIPDQAYKHGLVILTALLVLSFFQAVCTIIRTPARVSSLSMVRAYAFIACIFMICILLLAVTLWFLALVVITCR
jgi:hypothetical protein